ncbi:SDR family oxidoreductase [Amycolatopsis lexingtonensis]|uniref:SDR family oxidoreductase n=1 Tax=Amycolatopsis lexingtonensis TaxID=218822 RepID=UPI003F705438
MARVLVTGGSGFVGAHCLVQLLAAGHEAAATVRDPARADEVRAMLRQGGAGAKADQVAVFAADLTADAGWAEAVAGCDYVLHVASPYPASVPKDENELIVPAREGALRVLRAARDAGVKRVVLTSSFAAIGYGHHGHADVYTEEDWSDPRDPDVQPYQRSKTLAERAAWDFIAREGGGLELAVVNPVGIMGPVLGPDYSTSIQLVKRLLDGALPGCPDVRFGVVDVRDVAGLHLTAMADPAARGERFLAVSGDFLSAREIALALKNGAGDLARKVPTRTIPNWLVRAVALVDPAARQLVPELGKRKNASGAKAARLLGWQPRSPQEALVATARSLLEQGLLPGHSSRAA